MSALTAKQFAAVGLGGIGGALIRYIIVELCSDTPLDGMWSVAVVNLVGCAVLPLIIVYGETHWDYEHRWQHLWRPFLTTGVMGGFTTTSAFAVYAVTTSTDNQWTVPAFLLVSVVGGMTLFHFAHKAASQRWGLLS